MLGHFSQEYTEWFRSVVIRGSRADWYFPVHIESSDIAFPWKRNSCSCKFLSHYVYNPLPINWGRDAVYVE